MERQERNLVIRQSRQRARILELLQQTDVHPTADWLYDRLKKEFPQLSLGTVYRNLAFLIDQGLVKKIYFGSTFDRFEANISPHYHLICEECGAIIDLTMTITEDINQKAGKLTNFTIKHHKIEFFGTCANCPKAVDDASI
jgi:Fur family transcriptional regulator, peroxide stress response regulator